MLNFVLGRSGSGKSAYLKSLFCNSAKNSDKKLLFIVPDQSTFDTETKFLELLGPKLSQKILVLGFSRLCDYVFEKSGNRYLSFADEGVRHVVMSVALEQVKDELELFKRRANETDLCDLMLNNIKEFKKCNISEQMLFDASENCKDKTLSLKLYESALVYAAYNAIMSKSYLDPLDSLSKVASILENNCLFKDYIVAVDSFYGFTMQEYEVLQQIISQCSDIYVALEDDMSNDSDTDIFFVPHRTKRRLKNIAKNIGISIAKDTVLGKNLRFKSADLAAVEENIYRIYKTPYDQGADNVTYYLAKDIYDECDFIARTIRKLLEKDKYRYKDIAIVTRNIDKYSGIVENVFGKYDISLFYDKPFDIDSQPIVKLVTAAFDIINKGFDKDDVLIFIKSGLISYSIEDISDFENYIFKWDITGKAFFEKFTENPKGFCDSFTENDIHFLSKVESMRSDIIGKLLLFYNSCKNATAEKISRALVNLLYSFNCRKNIDALCDYYDANNQTDLSDELVRIWNILCEILDKMVYVIGDYSISSKRFAELLYTYFSNTEISFIPRGIDQVDFASADRVLLSDKKCVFVIGAIDGEFPHTPVESGVFTDNERIMLKDMDIPVSDTIEELTYTEKYYAYTALTCASEKLFVSSYMSELSSEGVVASSIVSELFSSVPKINHIEFDLLNIKDHLWSKESAFSYLVEHYHSNMPDIAMMKEYFFEDSDYKDIIKSIDEANARKNRTIKDKELSKKLFKQNSALSASQIDLYHRCPYNYFCRYGLNIKERRKATIDALEYGTLMHYVLEKFFSNHKDDDFFNYLEFDVDSEISSLLDEYIKNHLGSKENKSKRFLYLYYRMKKAAVNLVKHILQELSQSDFKPSAFELKIGEDIPSYEIKLNDDISIRICGSVDRVDTLKKDGKTYIRVIDYKTGTKKFDLSDILYGINLQMLIYMSAIDKNGSRLYTSSHVPSGILYMPAVSPVANAEKGDTVEQIEKKKDKKYTMQGIVVDDLEILESMEHGLKGRYIPVTLSKDQLKDSESLITLEQMGQLFKKVEKLVGDMADNLINGEINPYPIKSNKIDACEWCPYIAVCNHQDNENEHETQKLSKAEVFKILQNEEEGREDEQNMD